MSPQTFDGFKKTGLDNNIDAQLDAHLQRFAVTPLDAVKHFPVLARRQLLKRFLAHVEFFKMTLEVPGNIAELGVFRGLGLMTWANLLEAFCIGDRTKIVYGFDNWEGFVGFSPEDGKPEEESQKILGGFSPRPFLEELESAIAIYDQDRFIPWKDRVKLVKGNIEETVPAFVAENPGCRFSLVHFDCDLYKPTRAALEALWPKVSRGGVLLFDEYGIEQWPGETAAVDEFLADKPGVAVKTLPWTNAPAGYIVKNF